MALRLEARPDHGERVGPVRGEQLARDGCRRGGPQARDLVGVERGDELAGFLAVDEHEVPRSEPLDERHHLQAHHAVERGGHDPKEPGRKIDVEPTRQDRLAVSLRLDRRVRRPHDDVVRGERGDVVRVEEDRHAGFLPA